MRNKGQAIWSVLSALCLASGVSGCTRDDKPDDSTFYERRIGPVLSGSCAKGGAFAGCHVLADDRGNALGNLDLDSFEGLNRRRDLLVNYGPYGIPGLLLKVVPPFEIRLTSWDNQAQPITTDIAHVGSSLLDRTSSSFSQIERWIENGASVNNAPIAKAKLVLQACRTNVGSDPLFNASVEPTAPDYAEFDAVNTVLGQTCAAGNCHGSPSNSLYLTCGDNDEQKRWNYFAAGDYVSVDPAASEILRRALDPSQGGTYHEGGTIFSSTSDPNYEAIQRWAVKKSGPTNVPTEPGFDFFAKRVQPMLVKRGCMMLGCHSAAMFHDYRLRGGSGGHFGLPATRQNYRLTLEQAGLESPDPNASRLVRKNLAVFPDGRGMLHRGGSLFGRAGDPTLCDPAQAETAELDQVSPYCVIVTWLAKERAARMGSASLTGIVYVRRPPHPGQNTPQDYAVFSAGADVILETASLDAMGDVSAGGSSSLSQQCGLNPATSDARRPAVSWDGKRIAFSARRSAAEPWQVYVVEGASCAPDGTINAASAGAAGNELIHNFDPAFAPDGSIVFTSTRGNVTNADGFSYQGPQRAPADPSKLNANLYVSESGSVRQLTFLLNQELTPSFMSDGRVIFTTEKRATDFYQLAGRRINLDGGDYHPLFAQRSTIGYTQLTDIVELTDKNFAGIFSERGAAHGAGTLVLINRSLGVDQLSTEPVDYSQDPEAIAWPNPDFYQHSTRIIDGAATGRLDGTSGAYKNPAPLPNGKLLVSYAANVQNLATFSGNFDVFVIDPVTGARTPLITGPEDELWPVGVYARQDHGVFRSKLPEPNGATAVNGEPDRSEILFLDVPLLTSLLFQNTRTGRILPETNPPLGIWESLPPEPGVTSFAAGGSFVTQDKYGDLYVRRQLHGNLTIHADGSAKAIIPGGMPLVMSTTIKLAGDPKPTQHWQREEMQFYPGEVARQSFRRDMFNGLCAGCHGSISGFETHVAVNPDILTRASEVSARDSEPSNLMPASGSATGPPFP